MNGTGWLRSLIPAPRTSPENDTDTPQMTTEQTVAALIQTGRDMAFEQRPPTDDQLHQALRQKTPDCPNCAYRYSRCYCPAPEP